MLPEGFEARMRALLGSEYEDFLASFDRPLCTGLRRNPLKTGFTGDLSRFSLSPVPWCPTGFYYDAVSRPGLSPYHAAGLYYLQEPSAMAPAELLDPQPGEHVLDLCAAPGGKSTQLAGKLRGKGILVCNEINAKRAKILSGNIERLGISNALVLNEHPKRLEERFAGYFDKILVDAPCSGEGMFRKEEAAVTDWTEDTNAICANRQLEIRLRGGHAPPGRTAGLFHMHLLACGKRGRDLGLFVEKSRFFCRKAGRAVLFSRQTRLGGESRAGIGKNVPPLAA